MAKLVRKPVAPIYAAAAVWVVWGLFFPFYRLPHFVLAALLSWLVWLAVGLFCREKTVDAPPAPQKAVKPANAEHESFLKEAASASADMARLRAAIREPEMRAQLQRVEDVFARITAHIRDNPQKLPRVRKFMSYYLPVTIKQFETYAEMSETGVAGDNIVATMGRIRDVMDTIVPAFEKQLDSLYGDVALDISTDITVLETMLAREGLTEPDMKG